jgi:hypothetical protein
MPSSELSKCAGPNCPEKWYRLGEGKLFSFHLKNLPSEQSTVKHVWLCESCFENWEASLYKDGKVVLVPLHRRAS